VSALSQIERTGEDLFGCEIPESPIEGASNNVGISAHVLINRGSNCILEKKFSRSPLSIGRSLQSDIVLQDSGISRHHVDIYFENQKIFIFVAPQKKALLINGQPVMAGLIDPGDTIELGPYTVKVQTTSKNDGLQVEDDLRYQVVFEGKIQKEQPPDLVAQNLKKWLKHDDQQTAAFITGNPVVIKKDLNLQEAIEFKNLFEESGAVGQVQAITESGEIDTTPSNENSALHLLSESEMDPKKDPSPANQHYTQPSLASVELLPLSETDEDVDEEDDDNEAAFCLKEILSKFDECDRPQHNMESSVDSQLGVFKFLKDTVIDVCYLDHNKSYFIQTTATRFRLARKNGSDKGYFYFSDGFTGSVNNKASGPVTISDLFIDKNLYHKRKGIYRHLIAESDEVFINDGCYDYLIRPLLPGKSPEVPESPPIKKLSWKHGVISLMVHMLFLAVLTFLPASQLKEAAEPETRFVQVDPQLLDKLQEKHKPVVKPPPKKPKQAAKSLPKKKLVKKKEAVKKNTSVKKKSAKVTKKPIKTAKRQAVSKASKKARKSVTSKHPKAGGGHGKGNTNNRNVNQVGILSMLGDSKGAQVQPAVADVTNLDAVRSANSGQAKFKVGGIKGKLGTSEISVTGGDVVATKGNSQVLRSYGAGGDGRVAALEKGNVGQKKVMGMVRARLNKSVKIRGGMSREDVKRVIEQHLDEITYCYETALISNPSIKGKITMEWKILMSGAVGEVRIKSSTIKSPEIYGCIKSAIRTWQFPKPVGNEVVVSYPFIFDIVGF
jgi:pSer/pThr/pTyr-binding forkhead associated (FHA) protein/outer membrane biosynthesis protein TonB